MGAEKDIATFTLRVIPEGEKSRGLDITSEVKSFTFEDNEKKADKLTLVLDNHDLRFWDDDTFKKGHILEAAWGYPGMTGEAVQCVIKSLSGDAEEFKIEAYHKVSLMNQKKRSRVFSNMTRAAVVKKVAEEWGYGSDAQQIEDTKIKHFQIGQAGETDAQFLRRLAKKEGFEFYVDGDSLHFHRRLLNETPKKVFKYYTDDVGEILDWSVDSDSKGRKGRVQAKGRDPLNKKSFSVDSNNKTVPRHALASVLEVVDEKTGQTSLQTRMAHEDVVPTSETTPQAAKAKTDGAYFQSQEGNFKLKLTIVGDPEVRAKRVIEVQGIGRRLSGLWYVKEAKHEIEAGQYLTKLECRRSGHNGHKGSSKDAKTDGTLNEKKASEKPREVEVVNSRTGETHKEWRR